MYNHKTNFKSTLFVKKNQLHYILHNVSIVLFFYISIFDVEWCHITRSTFKNIICYKINSTRIN